MRELSEFFKGGERDLAKDIEVVPEMDHEGKLEKGVGLSEEASRESQSEKRRERIGDGEDDGRVSFVFVLCMLSALLHQRRVPVNL